MNEPRYLPLLGNEVAPRQKRSGGVPIEILIKSSCAVTVCSVHEYIDVLLCESVHAYVCSRGCVCACEWVAGDVTASAEVESSPLQNAFPTGFCWISPTSHSCTPGN